MKTYPASAIVSLCLVCVATMQAQTFTTLVNFNAVNGNVPVGLIQGSDGNFYGTTFSGGANLVGTVFKIAPAGVLTTLYSFTGNGDGASPQSGLIQATDGNFYGTASSGGTHLQGVVYKITSNGTLTTLHSFGSIPGDGAKPYAGLVQGSDGNFYGTTAFGGDNGLGTVFKITPTGTLTTLFVFGTLSAKGYPTDGATPQAGLILGTDGNFYGTTTIGGVTSGGAEGAGTFFKITPAGTLTTLYTFAQGSGASAGLVQASDGNFYGTSGTGGALGSIFKLTPSGALTTLYNFGSSPNDGAGASSTPLVRAGDGNLYGTSGTDFFKVTLGGSLTKLYTLPSAQPSALIQGTDGNFYGSYPGTGTNGDGLVFRIQLTGAATYTCTNTTPPVIASIDSASSYGGYSYFSSGSWLEIKGSNLADPGDPRLSAATNPGQWTGSDFNGSNAPTSLDGITVSINGKPAYVWYLSTGQINVQAPEDTATGAVAITVTNCNATSNPVMFTRRALAPGFLAPSNYTANGTPYMVATFQSDGAYVLNTATGAAFGLNSRAAKPGDGIVAYGIGFGDVTPSVLPGVIVGQSNALVNPVTISFGATRATVSYAGLAGGFVGLYEFYFTVPSGLASGDYQINVTQNGTNVPQTMYLTVQGSGTVVTPQVQSVTLSSASVTGGGSVQGTVTLSAAAPAGGAVVVLGSNSSAASVPSTVTVPAGGISAGFTITTVSVSSNQTATITASYGGVSQQAVLSVVAAALANPQVQSLTLSASSVASGGTVQGTVTLTGAAPAGGAVVVLSSNSSAATVPGTVTVAAGATSAMFTVSAGTISSNQTVTITASYGGGSAQAGLTVLQPGVPTFSLLVVGATFHPSGSPSGPVDWYFEPNNGGSTFSTDVVQSDPPFINCTASNGNLTFTCTQLNPPYTLFNDGFVMLELSSASLTFTLTPGGAADPSTGSVAGNLSVTGKLGAAGAVTTLSGPISGTYMLIP